MNKPSVFKIIQSFLVSIFWIGRFLVGGVAMVLTSRDGTIERRKKGLALTSFCTHGILNQLGIKISTNELPSNFKTQNYFLVCNHLSYMDILALSANEPSVFVTSVEMEKTFFLGDLAKLGGSFFVDRVNRRKMKEEVEKLKNLVVQGFNVFLFPEGSSTNGMSGILPFKKSLFRVPFQANIPILPICIKYHKINGERFSLKNCDRMAWHGDMTFGPHFFQLMGVTDVEISIEYLTPLETSKFKDHGELSAAAEKQIVEAYGHPDEW